MVKMSSKFIATIKLVDIINIHHNHQKSRITRTNWCSTALCTVHSIMGAFISIIRNHGYTLHMTGVSAFMTLQISRHHLCEITLLGPDTGCKGTTIWQFIFNLVLGGHHQYGDTITYKITR